MIPPGPGKGFDAKFAGASMPPQTLPDVDAADASRPADLQRLRELLLGDERRELDAARARIAALETAQRSLPQRLPLALEAIDAAGDSPRVARALARPVASALGAAVRENRAAIIDTLFPVIGPLIRKAIAEALRNLVVDLNGAIESSFTPRGLLWRFEAWRAGVPYAQVVLKHRLAFRIDHVFLIARDSGLVLQRESAPDLPALDADAIAGMLTAIGDFIGDSVGHGSGETLESARVGEHLVWVIQGPRANLACFMRGAPPAALHALLEQRLEEIHAQFAGMPLEQAASDSALVANWHASLQSPALLRDVAAEVDAPRRAPARWPLLLILLAVLVALAAFAARRERWDAEVEALRTRLQALPGFVLTAIDAEPWRSLRVHGLLDPDADAPDATLARAALGGVHAQLVTTAFLSADDAIVTRRAQRLLAPPAGVRMSVTAGILKLEGNAAAAWIAMARERAGWIAGVRHVEMKVVADTDPVEAARAQLATLAREMPALQIAFPDAAIPDADAPAGVERIAGAVRRAVALAGKARMQIAFTCVGSNDEIGSGEANRRVREARARWLADALVARGVGDQGALAIGEDTQSNRRAAYLRMTITADPP